MSEQNWQKDLYLKNGKSFIPVRSIEVGRIKLKSGDVIELGNTEERFDMDLTLTDKLWMSQIESAFKVKG